MKLLKIFIFLSLCLNSVFAFAATVDHFKINFSKDEVKAGEAVDLTIEAVDENDIVVKDYTGNIVGFSETDNDAILPDSLSSDDGYTFKLSDEGVIKFENAVKFQTPGEQELSIYDVDGSTIGIGKIKVLENSAPLQKEKIKILSPENGLTIGKNKITVSGESKKNHKILIAINGKEEFETITNSDGIFEKEVDGLENGENLIQAFILDSDDEKIGESEKIVVKINSNGPQFKKITLSPLSESGEIEEGKNMIINVFATAGLSDVNIVLNDSLIKLEETDDGVYVGNTNIPDFDDSKDNSYDIDVILKDDLGHKTEEKAVSTIKVTKVSLPVADTSSGEVVTTTNNIESVDEFDITGLKLVKLKNKSILTWDEVKDAEGYNVYKKIDDKNIVLVETVTKPIFEVEITGEEIKYQLFAVKAYKSNGLEKTYEGNLSEATEIQTGPEIIILLLLSLIFGGGLIYLKSRKA